MALDQRAKMGRVQCGVSSQTVVNTVVLFSSKETGISCRKVDSEGSSLPYAKFEFLPAGTVAGKDSPRDEALIWPLTCSLRNSLGGRSVQRRPSAILSSMSYQSRSKTHSWKRVGSAALSVARRCPTWGWVVSQKLCNECAQKTRMSRVLSGRTHGVQHGIP